MPSHALGAKRSHPWPMRLSAAMNPIFYPHDFLKTLNLKGIKHLANDYNGLKGLLVVAKAKERNPQMSPMTQMGAAPHKERKIMICGHLRHLRIPLAGATLPAQAAPLIHYAP